MPLPPYYRRGEGSTAGRTGDRRPGLCATKNHCPLGRAKAPRPMSSWPQVPSRRNRRTGGCIMKKLFAVAVLGLFVVPSYAAESTTDTSNKSDVFVTLTRAAYP